MKRLPFSLVVLILFLAFFFNLERIDVGEDVVNLQSFVYVLGTAAVVVTMLIPLLFRRSVLMSILFWALTYLALKGFVFTGRPLWGGVYTYVNIVELGLLCIGVLLARVVGRNLEDFVRAVESITFEGGNRVRSVKESTDLVQTEIYRSRRFQHSLTLVVVEPQPSSVKLLLQRTIQEVQRSMMSRYVTVSLAKALRDQLRRTDLLLEQPELRRFVILTPETDLESSSVVVSRVNRAAQQLGVAINTGVASFPEDALTFDELVTQAEARLQTSTNVEEEE